MFAARCRILLFLIPSFFCYVLYLCKVLWVLDWCAMVVLLVVCAVSCGVIHYLRCVDVGHVRRVA